MSQYYLVASLPGLFFGDPPPFSAEALLGRCEGVLDAAGLAELGAVVHNRLDQARSPFARAWDRAETQLRSAVASARGDRLREDASPFLRDFGLAVFVAIVGISAGPQAITTMKEYGVTLFFLGVGVTIIPQIVVFYFSYYVLRIRNPIEALGCVVGGRSANPGFAALLAKAGNATPVVSFTVCYAVANVFRTIWGPRFVGSISKNP